MVVTILESGFWDLLASNCPRVPGINAGAGAPRSHRATEVLESPSEKHRGQIEACPLSGILPGGQGPEPGWASRQDYVAPAILSMA